MATVGARAALEYALSRDMIALYLLLVAGYAATVLGSVVWVEWALRGGGAGTIGRVVAAALTLGGVAAALAGLVAAVYKVVADANHAARS